MQGKPRKIRISTVLALLLILGWCGATLVFDALLASGMYWQRRALGFPRTEGRVIASGVRERRDGDGAPTKEVDVRYVYSVAGRRYEGDKLRFISLGSSGSWADEVVASLPVGKVVPVWYSSDEPSRAVLQPGLGGGDLAAILFLIPFNAIASGALSHAFYWRRRARREEGGATVIEAGAVTRVRAPMFGAPATAISVGALASFVSSLVVLGIFGLGTSLGPPLGALTLVVLLGARRLDECRGRGALPRLVRAADQAGGAGVLSGRDRGLRRRYAWAQGEEVR